MARYTTSIRTTRSSVAAFEYMADLRNFKHWDPGVKGVTQVAGEGAGADAVFDVVVNARGGLTLRYHTTHFDPPRKVVIEAKSRLFTSIDQIDVREESGSTVVTYEAGLAFNGPLRVFDVVMRPFFNRIGDRAKVGLLRELDGQPA